MKDDLGDSNPFLDKRDAKFIKLRSNSYFFEMFDKKKTKCDQSIPHSIIFSDGKSF